jgi:hypothetical protein
MIRNVEGDLLAERHESERLPDHQGIAICRGSRWWPTSTRRPAPAASNFYELVTAGPAPIASEALKHIASFYEIEKEIRGRSAEERRRVQQQTSRPLADAFEAWLRAKLALISHKLKLAEAIRYALSRWQGGKA